MKVVIAILACINGLYMLIDGIYVMITGKYIGPEKPGPWAMLFEKWQIDVFRLGPLFIVFGLLWLAWLYSFYAEHSMVFLSGLLLSVLSLWYLPVGTLFSVVIIVSLCVLRNKGAI